MAIAVRWESASVVGKVRETNEDAWGARTIDGTGGLLLAVADGMGGLPGGEVASKLAIEASIGAFTRLGAGATDPRDLLRSVIDVARTRLADEAGRDLKLSRMGTTLTLLLVRPDGGWVGHLGDSRLLWCRGREIALVTQDHSAAWPWVTAGRLTPEQAERDPLGSVLTRHLSPTIVCEPDILDEPLDLAKGDRLLLCTDGLGKVVSMERIVELVSRPIEEAVRALVADALDGGGPDNITVVLAEILESPRPRQGALPLSSLHHRWNLAG
jgi:protein phosphatase